MAQSTIVVYTSDQGFYLGEHGWFDKRWIYEQSLRTPLLIRWPEVIAPGSINRDIVSPLDFAETFLDVAEAPVPEDMQGNSLVPLLKGRSPANWRKSLYYQYFEYPAVHSFRRHYGVVDGRYKLIHFYEPDIDEWDRSRCGSRELKTFYDDPAYAKVQLRLKEELAHHRRNLNVPEQDPPETYPQKMRDWLEKNDPQYQYPSSAIRDECESGDAFLLGEIGIAEPAIVIRRAPVCLRASVYGRHSSADFPRQRQQVTPIHQEKRLAPWIHLRVRRCLVAGHTFLR